MNLAAVHDYFLGLQASIVALTASLEQEKKTKERLSADLIKAHKHAEEQRADLERRLGLHQGHPCARGDRAVHVEPC